MERAGLLPGVNPVGRHCTCHNVRYREQKPIQLVRGGTESAAPFEGDIMCPRIKHRCRCEKCRYHLKITRKGLKYWACIY